mmetsp:Transcript_3518/g.10233  ORF Transcript_3518/g.10233 Transcript_3518/m.10233 type:complete len:158 (-) Transcript_3518:218-691(-)
MIATGSLDSMVKVHRVDGSLVASFDVAGDAHCVGFAMVDDYVVVCTGSSRLQVWHVDSAVHLGKLAGVAGAVSTFAIGADGAVVIGAQDYSVKKLGRSCQLLLPEPNQRSSWLCWKVADPFEPSAESDQQAPRSRESFELSSFWHFCSISHLESLSG